ncbi:MAG: hypothetical protein KAU14_02810, partial [Thermoplasmata archaeon]|nr:hypothetical protein [Thermoplasmata archaeon]
SDLGYFYFPYRLTATYRGAENSTYLKDMDNTFITIVVPFPRPELKVCGLEIKNSGFSLWGNNPREDEKSYICFKVKNTGKGKAENTTVVVLAGEKELERKNICLEPGEEMEFKVKWIPENEGKINISVKVYEPDEPNAIEKGLNTEPDVGENQRGYYYAIVLLSVLVILALIWWMAGNIEGADEIMARFTRNLRIKLADFLETWARRLKIGVSEAVEKGIPFIPTGTITSWDGQPTIGGSGRYKPWSIEEENILKEGKKDIITVEIKIPPPEPEGIMEDTADIETFEWVTARGEKERIMVDKETLSKLRHPKMYICSLCDRTFVSINPKAKCPWCNKNAIFLQEM